MAEKSQKTAKDKLAEKRALALRENLKRRKDAARTHEDRQDGQQDHNTEKP